MLAKRLYHLYWIGALKFAGYEAVAIEGQDDDGGYAGRVTGLILDQLRRADALPGALPWPRAGGLTTLCVSFPRLLDDRCPTRPPRRAGSPASSGPRVIGREPSPTRPPFSTWPRCYRPAACWSTCTATGSSTRRPPTSTPSTPCTRATNRGCPRGWCSTSATATGTCSPRKARASRCPGPGTAPGWRRSRRPGRCRRPRGSGWSP